MKMGISKLIPENIAPSNISSIAIFKKNEDETETKICNVDISKMRPSNLGEKLYSFGMVSDMHLDGKGNNGTYLSEALTFYENQGCSFCCHAGDMTNIGFYAKNETTGEVYLYDEQMSDYKNVIDAHPTFPVYGICGNHESYNKSIMDSLEPQSEVVLEEYTNLVNYKDRFDNYTNYGLYYTYTHENDVFIFVGQPSGTPYAFGKIEEWKNELRWLQNRLEENRDKRCYVFTHLTLSDDSGNPNNIHNAYWGPLENTLVGIMRHYKNAILFHGHSHLYFTAQETYTYSNYSTKKGFKSISIPSSGGSRAIVDGVFIKNNNETLRSGYIADVYKNCIMLKGYNFHTSQFVPIAQYCIDTTIQPVEKDTFKDSTGVIDTNK